MMHVLAASAICSKHSNALLPVFSSWSRAMALGSPELLVLIVHWWLGRALATGRELQHWRIVTAAHTTWLRVARTCARARGYGGPFGTASQLFLNVYLENIPKPRGMPFAPCPQVRAIMEALPPPVHNLVFYDERVSVQWFAQSFTYNSGHTLLMYEGLLQGKGFHQLLLQLVVMTRHQGRPVAEVVDLSSSRRPL